MEIEHAQGARNCVAYHDVPRLILLESVRAAADDATSLPLGQAELAPDPADILGEQKAFRLRP